jgi:hypothetical protein
MARPAKTTIVDAIKTETPSQQTVNVPVRLDASALTKALQTAAEQTAARVNAGELIKNSAIKIEEIYKRFDALKLLANELNGKPLTAPLPDTIQLDEITFKFRVAKAGNVSEMTTATVKTVVCVGDISPLLSSELGALIVQLEQEAAAVKNIATLTEETSSKARTAWEANNPDRKFTAAPADQVGGATGVSLAEQPAAAQTNDTGSI